MNPQNIPKNWNQVTLKDVAHKITDGVHKTPKYTEKGIRFISIANIKKFKPIDWESYIKYISVEEHKELIKRCHPEKGDIVFPRIGTLGYAKKIDWDEEVSLFVGLGLIKPNKKIVDTNYLEYYLNSPLIEKLSKEKATGTGRKTLALKESKKLPVLLPPIEEQKQIATKLGELLAQVDKIKTRLDAIPELLNQFKQSIFNQAILGTLTSELRYSNQFTPISKLLYEIQKERDELTASKKQKINKSSSIKPEKHIHMTLPSEWIWVYFDDISDNSKNALKAGPFGSSLKKSDCVSSGYKVYGQEQVISSDENLDTYYINEEKFCQLSSCKVKAGDILISLVGTIGKVLILSSKAKLGIINPRLIKISLNQKINREYIKIYLSSTIAKDFFKSFSHGGTMEILNLKIIKQLPIPLPPIEEQNEIVKRVRQLLECSNNIKEKTYRAQQKVDLLPQSILNSAFSGSLTEKWREANLTTSET